ncbi:hypothetical protein FB45DRAFT_1057301 [Roridomyces roridus]|uniref:Uncharacterized protein n=1 Tax=Roridomyces roridus TaxID=1738132 RepID=A0AAD7BVP6_9AGAR|nr:hypothetical protein FB45DRAFT_1057301 [Roridomyces roridus]
MQRYWLSASFLAFALLGVPLVAAQYINGQTFTSGLAIIDAPSPNNPGHAGSAINIAVDVSGDGKLAPAASVPGSSLSTRFDALEIYLVSDKTNINMTVSNSSDFLTGESGSTVKHLNFALPDCIQPGDYNLTFYETSHYNGDFVFTITPIPVPVSNTNSASADCNSSFLNPLQSQPQPDTRLSASPFAPNSTVSPPATGSNSAVSLLPFSISPLFVNDSHTLNSMDPRA